MKKIILLSLLMSLSMSSNADFQKMSQDGEKIALDSENWSCVVDDKNSLVCLLYTSPSPRDRG